jgi:hypothetical protein
VTPPATAEEETPASTDSITVSTDDDDVEVGGLGLVQLGGLLGLLAALAALLAAWRFFAGTPVVTFLTGAESGLTVAPADPDAEWYDPVENGFDFRLTETDTWREATDEAVSFGGVATVTNTADDTVLVSASVEGELPEDARLTVAGKETNLLTEPVKLASGETITASLDLPSDFDPRDVTIRFGERLER